MNASGTLTTSNGNPEETERPDTLYALFLNGDICVSLKLLNLVNINILKHIFLNLPGSESGGTANPDISKIKIVLLYLIVQKSKNPQEYEAIGGLAFFKNILAVTRDLYLL